MASSHFEIGRFGSSAPSWPWHWHEELQVVASLGGMSRFQLRQASQSVAPGELFIINPGLIHTINAEKGSCWLFLTAHLPSQLFTNDERRAMSFAPRVFRDDTLHQMLHLLYRATLNEDSLLDREERLHELVDAISRLGRPPLKIVKTGDERAKQMDRARDYLHAHFRQRISLSELAELSQLSEFHFCRQFSRRYHLSPHAYQIQLKLLEAKRQIRLGRPLSEVASLSGFQSQSHLTRFFSRTNGQPPGQFREKQQDRAST